MNNGITPEMFTAVMGFISQILFEYVPGFSTWYEPKTAVFKRLFMAGLLAVVAAGAVVGSCYFDMTWMTCSGDSIIQTVMNFFAALGVSFGVNQGTHALLKKAAA